MLYAHAILLAMLLAAPDTLPAVPTVPPDTLTASRADIHAFLFDEGILEEEQGEDVLAQIDALLDTPLDLNTASAHALSALPFLRMAEAEAIVQARQSTGPFRSLEEAFAAAEIPHARRPYLRAFLKLAPPTATPHRPWRVSVLQQAMRRLDLGEGYNPERTGTTYLGSPTRWLTRLQVDQPGRWQFRLTLNKHAGEPFAWAPEREQFGFTHAAGHVAWTPGDRANRVLLGDYQVALGQGLMLWRGMAIGKSTQAIQGPARRGHGIAPYQGTNPNGHFRGAAAQVTHGLVTAVGFVSHVSRDASLDTLRTSNGSSRVMVTSLPTAGRHRTSTELSRRAATSLQTVGGAVEVGRSSRHVGLAGYAAKFLDPVAPSEAFYQRMAFSGATAHGLSLYGQIHSGWVSAGAEVMRAHTGTVAGVAWLHTRVGQTADMLWHSRILPVRHVALFGNPMADQSANAAGERGLYMGLRLQPAPEWEVSGYADVAMFTWSRFRVDRPSTGTDVRARITYQPRRWLRAYLQGRSRQRELNATAGPHDTRSLTPSHRHDLRLHTHFSYSPALRFSTQIDHVWSTEDASSTRGVLLAQDVRWIVRPGLQLDARLAYFDTDSFAARVFIYEHDLLYSFSVPAFSGQGQRRYLMLSFAPWPWLDVRTKIAETHMPLAKTMGSGLDLVEGNRLREVRLHIRWRPWR